MSGKVLIDTSIWIGYLRRDPKYYQTVEALIDKMEGYITEPVIAELLQGVKTQNEFQKLKACIDALPIASCRYDDWINAGTICFDLKRKGITVPLVDALIASVATREGMELFSIDSHFGLMPELKLFDLYMRQN